MTAWEVYWWLRLDDLRVVAGLLGVPGTVFSFALAFVENGLNNLGQKFRLIIGLILAFTCLGIGFMAAFIPSTKDYAVIKVLPQIANSDFAKEATGDAKELYGMAKSYLKELMKENGGANEKD